MSALTDNKTTKSPLFSARAAGILYLVIIVCAGFSEGYIRSGIVVPGDAAATADNIAASESLFRVAAVGDLIAFLCDLAVSVLLYLLLAPVNRTLSLIAAGFRLVAHPAIASLNLLNHVAALQILGGADYLTTFDPVQLQALALFYLDLHGYGYLIAGAFFGVHCFLLGVLVFKSGYIPKILGILLVLAAIGYMVESFGNILFPAYESLFTWIVAVPAVVAELSFGLWLLIKGVNVRRWKERADQASGGPIPGM